MHQKYGKIKTLDKELFENGASSETVTLFRSKKSATKSAAASATKRASNGRANKAICIDSMDGEGESEEVMKTPSKKTKVKDEISEDTEIAMEKE
jgi:hypothetical protein